MSVVTLSFWKSLWPRILASLLAGVGVYLVVKLTGLTDTALVGGSLTVIIIAALIVYSLIHTFLQTHSLFAPIANPINTTATTSTNK